VTAPWAPGRAVAFDRDGKEIRQFSGAGGDGLHEQNFIDAVRSRKASLLHSPIRTASDTAAWCHLANITVRAGGRFSRAEAARVDDPSGHWNGAMEEMAGLLQAHGLDMENDSLRLSGFIDGRLGDGAVHRRRGRRGQRLGDSHVPRAVRHTHSGACSQQRVIPMRTGASIPWNAPVADAKVRGPFP
jgi:hypothetical protein